MMMLMMMMAMMMMKMETDVTQPFLKLEAPIFTLYYMVQAYNDDGDDEEKGNSCNSVILTST